MKKMMIILVKPNKINQKKKQALMRIIIKTRALKIHPLQKKLKKLKKRIKSKLSSLTLLLKVKRLQSLQLLQKKAKKILPRKNLTKLIRNLWRPLRSQLGTLKIRKNGI